jgi:hypothetical protein
MARKAHSRELARLSQGELHEREDIVYTAPVDVKLPNDLESGCTSSARGDEIPSKAPRRPTNQS